MKIVDRGITKTLNTIGHIINAIFFVSARNLSFFTGQIISTGPVVGIIGIIMARHCAMSTLCSDRVSLRRLLEGRIVFFGKQNLTIDIVCIGMP